MNHGWDKPKREETGLTSNRNERTSALCRSLAVIIIGLVSILTGMLTGCHSLNGSSLKNSEGVACYGQGQYDQALPYFQEAIRLDPNNAEAYYNVASTYQRQAALHGQPSLLTQAESYYRACLDRNPSPETTVCCYRGLATSMSQRNQGDAALALLKDWESRNPNSVEPKLELAYLLEAQSKYSDALALLQQSANLAPADYRVYYKTGVLQQKLGNEETALAQYLMAARLAPADQEIANRITVLQAKSDRKDIDPNALATVRTALPGALAPAPSDASNAIVTHSGTSLPNVSVTPPDFTAAESQVNQQVASTSQPGVNQARWVQTTSAVGQTNAGTSPAIAPVPTSPAPTPLPKSPLDSLPDGTGASPIPAPAASAPTAPPPVANAAATQPVLNAPAATPDANPVSLAPPVSDNLPNRKNKANEFGSGPPPIRAGSGL
ncbi:MAG: tetratricopeptide repeat protein [Planctomycetia bacterium]|nr:tetratricopeptide repeat protein [Planctomycetia bacterium]